MTKTRLEAFSDGVLAIIITIMVLELRPPATISWDAIKLLISSLEAYLLSFLMVAIYWGNHHHLLHTVSHINSKVIWANMHLLFWLSLIPFATLWMGQHNFDTVTVAIYAGLMVLCSGAYFILLRIIVGGQHNTGALQVSLSKQTRKGLLSTVAYLLAIPLAFIHPSISEAILFIVAVFWLIPDRNIEKALKE